MIRECTCRHETQDRLHGKQRRVHNRTSPKSAGGHPHGGWRCTVCGKVSQRRSDDPAA